MQLEKAETLFIHSCMKHACTIEIYLRSSALPLFRKAALSHRAKTPRKRPALPGPQEQDTLSAVIFIFYPIDWNACGSPGLLIGFHTRPAGLDP
jgi:hypothetical protein